MARELINILEDPKSVFANNGIPQPWFHLFEKFFKTTHEVLWFMTNLLDHQGMYDDFKKRNPTTIDVRTAFRLSSTIKFPRHPPAYRTQYPSSENKVPNGAIMSKCHNHFIAPHARCSVNRTRLRMSQLHVWYRNNSPEQKAWLKENQLSEV